MNAACLLSLLLSIFAPDWGAVMADAYLSRVITAGDTDSLDGALVADRDYQAEWLKAKYIEDGGFENGAAGWTLPPTGAYTWVDATQHRSGSYSLATTTAGLYSGAAETGYLPVNPSRAVYVGVWGKASSGSGSLIGRLEARTYTADYTYLAEQFVFDGLIPDSGWTSLSGALTLPATAAYVKIRLQMADEAGIIYWDDAYMSHEAGPISEASFSALTADFTETYTLGCPVDDPPFSDDPTRTDGGSIWVRADGGISTRASRDPRRGWSLTFDDITDAGREQLERFYSKQRGAARTFSYVDTSGVSYSVRFGKPPKWRVRTRGATRTHRVTLQLIREM